MKIPPAPKGAVATGRTKAEEHAPAAIPAPKFATAGRLPRLNFQVHVPPVTAVKGIPTKAEEQAPAAIPAPNFPTAGRLPRLNFQVHVPPVTADKGIPTQAHEQAPAAIPAPNFPTAGRLPRLNFQLHVPAVTAVRPFVGIARYVGLALIVCGMGWAGEYAILDSGFRMRINHHERQGDVIRLYTTKDAFVEMAASSVTAFEAEDYVPPLPMAAVPPAIPAAVGPVPAVPVDPRKLVSRAADDYGLPPALLHLVAKAESGYNANAVSPKGAIGIMQLMPGTAAALNVDPTDPEANVEAGARYLRELLVQYKDHPDQLRLALAAYNAGPGAVKRYNGVPPYRETQLYVEKIVGAYRKTLSPTPGAQ